jgi:hypothetical protein
MLRNAPRGSPVENYLYLVDIYAITTTTIIIIIKDQII